MRALLSRSMQSMQTSLASSLRARPPARNFRRRVQSVSSPNVLYAGEEPWIKYTLAEVLDNASKALRGKHPLDQTNTSAMSFGVGKHMGCDVSWTFIWRPDGAFYEEVRSRHLTYKWGFDGGSNSHCWEVDPTGVSKVLEFDDHEAALLGAIIKGGGWLVEALREQRLDVELEGKEGLKSQLWTQYRPMLNMPPVASTVKEPCTAAVAAAADGSGSRMKQCGSRRSSSSSSSSTSHHQQQQQLGLQLLQQQMQQSYQQQQTARDVGTGWQQHQQKQHDVFISSSGGGGGGISSSSLARSGPVPVVAAVLAEPDCVEAPEETRNVAVVMKLKGGRMLARMEIDPNSWQVVKASHPLCSEQEYWSYNTWKTWPADSTASSSSGSGSSGAPDVVYPESVEHVLFSGCAHHYKTLGAQARGTDIHRAYQLPASPPVPVDAQYLDTYSSRVPVWQTVSGHLLAECHINGRRAGWMILDTGASGFVIEPGVADQYALPPFGDLRIAGVAGKVRTRFRRASQLRIGPLLLSDPVLMEMRASKLVSGFHDRVVGIAGFDVFRRCRMTLPCHETRKGIIKATSSLGKVKPHVKGVTSSSSSGGGCSGTPALQWPPIAATAQQLVDVQTVQQQLLAAGHATADASPVSAITEQQHQRVQPSVRRRGKPAAASSSSLHSRSATAAATSTDHTSSSSSTTSKISSRRRRRTSSSSMTSSASVAPAALAESSSSSSSSLEAVVEQHPPQYVGTFVVPPRLEHPDRPSGCALIEMMLQRPQLIKGPHELEEGYIWQKVVMIASLPHIELEFISPGTGKRHRSLFMVDTGAAGSEVMFHSRASRELRLLEYYTTANQRRFISGVDGSEPNSFGPPQVAVQAGQLPEMVIHGQAGSNPNASGSLVLHNVAALFSKTGGLDISLYSAGMVCIDLLSRMQVVLDYPNKRIGWKIPKPTPVEQQTSEQAAAAAVPAAAG